MRSGCDIGENFLPPKHFWLYYIFVDTLLKIMNFADLSSPNLYYTSYTIQGEIFKQYHTCIIWIHRMSSTHAFSTFDVVKETV